MMDEGNHFEYYYGIEAEQFSFYRIPRLLIKDKRFKGLSSDAKLLYGLMLDSKKGIGLIEKKRQGLGRPDIIYVKNFAVMERQGMVGMELVAVFGQKFKI